MSNRAWILLIALALVWGGSFFFVEVALAVFDPFWIVAFRVGIGAVGLIVFNAIRRHAMPRDFDSWRDLAIMGLLNNAIPFGLICWGQTRIDSGIAAILNATTPLFAVILAALLIKEALTVHRVLGVVAGIFGVVLLVGPSALEGILDKGLAQIAVLVAALSYAFAGLWGRRLSQLPVSVSAAGMLISSTVLMVPMALVFGTVPDAGGTTPGIVISVIALGLACTSIAYLMYFEILRIAGPTNLMLVTFLVPVSAVALGMAFLGERLGLLAWAGMALIFIGLALVDGRILRIFHSAKADDQH